MERRLSAIVAADVVGYSRMMGANEAGTLAALKAVRAEIVDGRIATHQGPHRQANGRWHAGGISERGNAVACAAEIQRAMRERNAEVPRDRRIEFRIGINLAM